MHRKTTFALGEQPGQQPRGAGDRALESRQIDDVDADARDHGVPCALVTGILPPYSTVTDLARLRG
jgi:hypothetical protein